MWLRILIAGIIGGILVFLMGFVAHAFLQLQGRAFQNIPEGETFVDQLKARSLKPGLYWFPDMPTEKEEELKKAAQEEGISLNELRDRRNKELNDRFKAGPSGFMLVMPTGQDMMTVEMLIKELAADVISALLAAWIVSLISVDVGFGRRWLAVVVMGAFAWFSLTTSYGIWYHFPHTFIHDEFMCALMEWSVAGVAIAAIVRRRLVIAANTV